MRLFSLFFGKLKAPIFILLRSSPDWGKLTPLQFEAQAREFCRRVNRPENQTIETARLWDRTFPISFCQTRERLKALAMESLRAVTSEAFLIQVTSIETKLRRAAYIICDDDDWLSPELPAAIRNCDLGGTEGLVWGNAVFGPLKKNAREPVLEVPEALKIKPFDLSCHSNNYAVTSAYLRKTGGDLTGVLSHGTASQTFQSLRVKKITRCLSIKNTNPTSTVFLENGLAQDFSSRRLHELVSQYQVRARRCLDHLEEPVAWARPSIAGVIDLFDEMLAVKIA